jgi:hypothetical protein
MLRDHLAEGVDLSVECLDQAELSNNDRGERGLHGGRLTQRVLTQVGPNLGRLRRYVAAACLAQGCADPGDGQPCGPVGIGRGGQDRKRVACVEVGEGGQGGREVLTQRTAQPQHLPESDPRSCSDGYPQPASSPHRKPSPRQPGDGC